VSLPPGPILQVRHGKYLTHHHGPCRHRGTDTTAQTSDAATPLTVICPTLAGYGTFPRCKGWQAIAIREASEAPDSAESRIPGPWRLLCAGSAFNKQDNPALGCAYVHPKRELDRFPARNLRDHERQSTTACMGNSFRSGITWVSSLETAVWRVQQKICTPPQVASYCRRMACGQVRLVTWQVRQPSPRRVR